jgi:hypothetical protein
MVGVVGVRNGSNQELTGQLDGAPEQIEQSSAEG